MAAAVDSVQSSPLVDFSEQRRQLARAIRRRLVSHIAAGGSTDLAPSPLENQASVYADPARAELEQRELFGKLPLVAGLSRDIPQPGDSLLFEDVGPPILIVRGADGVARGFLNRCAHRGSKLVYANAHDICERRQRIVCPFHAWSYELDGSLVSVPGKAGFAGIDLNQRNLEPVPVVEWHGLLFTRASPGQQSLDIPEYLGSFAAELARLELAAAAPARSSKLTANTNWKLALDTYCEGYHFGTLHSSTIGVTHYSNVAAFDAFGRHWRIHFAERKLAALCERPESEWPEAEFGGVYFLFPNTLLVVGWPGETTGFARIFRLFPGPTPGRMCCRIAVYVLGGDPSEQAAAQAQFTRDDADSEVTIEDYRVAVDAYSNLVAAPAGFKLVFGSNEIALQAVHRSIADALGVAL